MTDLRAAAPEQEVSCRFCHDKRGCWTWQCYNCGEIDDVQQPTPPAAQQEPTPWRDMIVATLVREGIDKHKARELADHFAAQQKQEPVAWGVFEGNLHDMFFTQVGAQEMADLKGSHAEVRPLYTAPAQRPWQGLTPEEIKHLYPYGRSVWLKETYEAIEKALKERNHG